MNRWNMIDRLVGVAYDTGWSGSSLAHDTDLTEVDKSRLDTMHQENIIRRNKMKKYITNTLTTARDLCRTGLPSELQMTDREKLDRVAKLLNEILEQ